jgi:hypothetical protein
MSASPQRPSNAMSQFGIDAGVWFIGLREGQPHTWCEPVTRPSTTVGRDRQLLEGVVGW